MSTISGKSILSLICEFLWRVYKRIYQSILTTCSNSIWRLGRKNFSILIHPFGHWFTFYVNILCFNNTICVYIHSYLYIFILHAWFHFHIILLFALVVPSHQFVCALFFFRFMNRCFHSFSHIFQRYTNFLYIHLDFVWVLAAIFTSHCWFSAVFSPSFHISYTNDYSSTIVGSIRQASNNLAYILP